MGQIKSVSVEITVVIGRTTMPVGKLLQMGRGAILVLDALTDDEVWILANDHPLARGRIDVAGDTIQIVITSEANLHDFNAPPR